MSALLCTMALVLSPPAPELVDASASAPEPAQEAPSHTQAVHIETRVAPTTGAGAASNIQGRFRIHLDGNLFSFRHDRQWFEDDHMPEDDVEDVDNSVGVGIGQYNFGVGLGYGITDGLVVGAKFGLGFNHTRSIDKDPMFDGPDGIGNFFNYAFLPYVEYAFIPGGRVRPFVFVQGGVAGSHAVAKDTDDTGAAIFNSVSPVIGGGGGVHIFIIPKLSVDIFGGVDQRFNLGKSKVEIDGEIDPDLGDDEFRRNSLQTELSVMAGLSLWLGS